MPAAVKDLRSFLNDLRARYPEDFVSVRREAIHATRPLGVPFPERLRPTAEERARIRLEDYLGG